jgi:hypothetical protein
MLENFTWPDPGEDWWTMVGASVGASGPQILFAAARASGCTNTRAGKIAGYDNRQSAHGASRSVAVTRLLELHARQKAGTADLPIAGLEEIKQTLSSLLRSPDPQISLSAAVKLAAIHEAEQASMREEEDTDPEQILAEIASISPLMAEELGVMAEVQAGGAGARFHIARQWILENRAEAMRILQENTQ